MVGEEQVVTIVAVLEQDDVEGQKADQNIRVQKYNNTKWKKKGSASSDRCGITCKVYTLERIDKALGGHPPMHPQAKKLWAR